MTVSTATSRVDYTGNGVTTVFAVPFPFIEDSYLTVIRTVVATGAETTLVLNSGGADGYTVSGAGQPVGSVTVVTAPTGAQRLSIIRAVPGTQEADFVANDPFPAETFENGLDKLQMQINDNATRASRSPVLYDSDIDGSGRYNSNGNRYANAADGISATDLATVQQITSAGSGNFVQAGAGSVVRTMQNKVREILSVKDFGATGDGATDDTAAIQAAIDYVASLATSTAEGATLRFPPGRYQISASLNIVDQMVVQGDGAESTKIQITNGIVFNVTSSSVQIRDIFILGPSGAASNGIKLTGGNNCIIERCVFQNQTTGIELSASYAVEIISCVFDVCYTYGIYSGISCHNLMVERCGFFTVGVLNNGQAINIAAASDNLGFKDNDFEFCNVNIKLASCNSVEITGNYMEYHSDECFDFTGTCTGIIIESNWIALGGAVSGGDTLTLSNITGGRFRHNTIYNQTVSFDSATLVGFTAGLNHKFGTGTLAKAPWITPTLLNSWAQQANYTAVGYIKDENGWVHLRGALVSGTAPNVMFTLPAAYRPAAIGVFAVDSASGPGRITVNTNGDVVPTVASSNNACLDGISFYVG